MASAFQSLRHYNYRWWASGALISNIGTWMQRTGQDWLVLTELTHNNASALGIVMALQFGPQMVLMPITGWVAESFDRRKILIVTQIMMAFLAIGLGSMTLLNVVKLWHVYGFALALGCVTAFDATARQTFVNELVSGKDLSNAVALNATSFNAARLIGPAVAGVLINLIGSGWIFIMNAFSFIAMLTALYKLNPDLLIPKENKKVTGKHLVDGIYYVFQRSELRLLFFMLFMIGAFGLNFTIFISTMTVSVLKLSSEHYGALVSTLAIGSVSGSLFSAKRTSPTLHFLLFGVMLFAIALILGSLVTNYWLFSLFLILCGFSVQIFTTTTNARVQLSISPEVRGRVMAFYLATSMGSTLIGAPIVGWIAQQFGAPWAMRAGASAALICLFAGIYFLISDKNIKIAK